MMLNRNAPSTVKLSKRSVSGYPMMDSPFRQHILCLCLSIALAQRVLAEPQSVTLPLQFSTSAGCAISDRGAELWSSLLRKGSGQVFYFEAERAQKLSFKKGKAIGRSNLCGGNAFVSQVTNADFPLDVKTAGTYYGWARCYLPRRASWNHTESMDGGTPRRISESAAGIFGKWFWSPLGSYTLTAGKHTFVLHKWLGGARLDCIMFTQHSDFQASVGGVPSIDDPTGTLTTESLLPPAVQQWQSLHVAADLNGGTVKQEISQDEGKSWMQITDGDLSRLKANGDGRDSLMARLTLKAAENGVSPVVRKVAVEFLPAKDAEVVLENRHYRIAFAGKTGRLSGMYQRSQNLWVTPRFTQQAIWGMSVREPGQTSQTVIEPGDIKFEGLDTSTGQLALRYSALDGTIRTKVELRADDTPISSWQITVENRSDLEIIRLDFPLIRNASIGDYRDDECVLPHTGGKRVKTPARNPVRKSTYMGGGSMSWIDLCDRFAGLYIAMHDRLLTTTEMECNSAEGGQAVDLAMRTHTIIQPGQTKTRDYVVGLHGGDWHWAADQYRKWAYSWMKRPQDPEWVKWCDGWIGVQGAPFKNMKNQLAQAKEQGIPYVQHWGQMADGIDQCCGNFYWPAPELGGAKDFIKGIDEVHALGGKVTGYMNCQTWTRDSYVNKSLRQTPKSELPTDALRLIHPLEWFQKWRLFPLNGEPVGYYAAKYGWYIMCPASDGFREHLRFWIVDMYAKRFGADGVYLDQAGATLAKPCYNLDHGHKDIGRWGLGNLQLLKTVIEEARKVNPDFIMAIEGSADALGQYASLHLISGLCTHPEVYHYTFPEHILISGLSNNSHLTFEQRISRAFLNGDRFDSRTGAPGIQSALQLRRRVRRWLYPGRFMDTVGLALSDEKVLGRWTRYKKDGERAIIFTFDNEQRVEDAVCRLKLQEGWQSPIGLFVLDREGQVRSETPVVEENQLRFEISKSTLSAGLLIYETHPKNQLDVWQQVSDGGALEETIRLNAIHLGSEPLQAQLQVRGSQDEGEPLKDVRLTMSPGKVERIEIKPPVPQALQKPARFPITLSWPGGKRNTWAEIRPLLLNSSLALDEDEDRIPDYWRIGGTTRNFPYGYENGVFWIQGQKDHYQYLIQQVPLKKSTKYSLAGSIRRSKPSPKVSIAVVEFLRPKGLRVHRIGAKESAPAMEWKRFETAFITGEQFHKCAVYLYNTHSDAKAWYRDLELLQVKAEDD